MTTMFEERERAAEELFALDEELRFLALARRNKMLGAWMCERLNLGGREAEAYKSRLVERLRADLAAGGAGAEAEADELPALIARYGAEAARTVREQARPG